MNCFEFGPEPEKKCVICAVDMWSSKKKTDDKVNFYVYDKKKYAAKMSRRRDRVDTVEYVEPICSTNYCHSMASYITYGSLLFRIGGSYFSHHDTVKICEAPCTVEDLQDPRHMRKFAEQISLELDSTRTVDIIDLNSEDHLMVATKGPEMKVPRIRPHLLILQGNLYVAGGLNNIGSGTSINDVYFMEVLNKSAGASADWLWEPVPNPPPFCVSSTNELPSDDVITGAVESNGVIVVGFRIFEEYSFYTYKPATTTWEFFTTNITLTGDLDCLASRPAVECGKFMLWLWYPGDYTLSTLLYVMDRENDKLISIDLCEKKLLPRNVNLSLGNGSPILLKLKEGKFCVFWTETNVPQYSSGPHTYLGLHASTFTLKTRKGREEEMLHVKLKKRYISLIPDLRNHSLEEVCIADVPESKRHNKRWSPFC